MPESNEPDVHGAPEVPASSPRARRWMLPVAAGLAVAAAGLGLTWAMSDGGDSKRAVSGGGDLNGAATFTLTGTLTLKSPDHIGTDPNGGSCTGINGDDGIHDAAPVTVYSLDRKLDPVKEKVLARGALGAGKPKGSSCVLSIKVPGVPKRQGGYDVELTNGGVRERIDLTEEDALDGNFDVTMD